MNPPSVVVFDLGKVLVDFDYSIAAGKMTSRCKVIQAQGEDLEDFLSRSPLLCQYETGLLTTEQFYRKVCAATGFSGSLDEFGGPFSDIFVPIEPMIELQSTLRRQGVPRFIFSNTNELAVSHIRRSFPFFNTFDGYVFSYEHGAMKPDARLYEVVERRTGKRGSEILYLDDRPENIATGTARGWQVILHETPEKSRAAIQQFGLLAAH